MHFGKGYQISIKRSLKGFQGQEIVFWPSKWPKMAIFYVFKLSPLRVTLILFLKNYLKKFLAMYPSG